MNIILDVPLKNRIHKVYINDLISVVGFSTICSISKLSKLNFIPNDNIFSTQVSDSLVAKCLIDREVNTTENIYQDLLKGIAHVYVLGTLITHKPKLSWYYVIKNVERNDELTNKSKEIVEKYKPLFYNRLMREYDTRPENDLDKMDIFFFFVFIIILLIVLALVNIFIRDRYKKDQIMKYLKI